MKQIMQKISWVCLLLSFGVGLVGAVEPPVEEAPAGYRLVPPWELTGPLVVVWPEGLSGGRRLIPGALELIQALPGDLDMALASVRPPRVQWLPEIGRDLRYLPLTTVRSLRIGEWSGFAAATGEGRLFAMRFQLPVHPGGSSERAEQRDNYEAARQLGQLLYGKTLNEIPLRMGRLHVTHNGHGVALVSNRIIADNQEHSLLEIRSRLQHWAGLETVIFIPAPAAETQGFIDGWVRFVGPQQLLVSEPLPGDEASRRQHQDLLRVLERDMPDGMEIIRVPRPSQAAIRGPTASYLHLIQAGHVLLCPQFGVPEDRHVIRLLERQLEDVHVVPVGPEFAEIDPVLLPLNRISVWR